MKSHAGEETDRQKQQTLTLTNKRYLKFPNNKMLAPRPLVPTLRQMMRFLNRIAVPSMKCVVYMSFLIPFGVYKGF